MGSCLSSTVKKKKVDLYTTVYNNEKLPASVRKAALRRMIRSELTLYENSEIRFKLVNQRLTKSIADKKKERNELFSNEKRVIDNIKSNNPRGWGQAVETRIESEWNETFVPEYVKLRSMIKVEESKKAINDKKLENVTKTIEQFQNVLDGLTEDEEMPSPENANLIFGIVNKDFEPLTPQNVMIESGAEQKKFEDGYKRSTDLVPLMKGDENSNKEIIKELMAMMGITGSADVSGAEGSGIIVENNEWSKSSRVLLNNDF